MSDDLFAGMDLGGDISDSTGNILGDINGGDTGDYGVGYNPGDGYINDPGYDVNDPGNYGPGGTGNSPGDNFSGGDYSGLDPSTIGLLDSIGLGPSGPGGDGSGQVSPQVLAAIGQLLQTGGAGAAQAIKQLAQSGGLGQFLSNLGSLASKGMDAAAMGTYLATAYKQYQDAGKYQDTARDAANRADPFGDRSLYKTKLDQTYTDPQGFLNADPTYNFLMKQGLSGLGQTDASNGSLAFGVNGMPTGGYAKDIIDYSQGAASKTLNDQRTQLAGLAGAGFDPANAARITMQGNQQTIDAQNRALANIGGALQASGGTKPIYQNTVPEPLPNITAPPQTGMEPPPDPTTTANGGDLQYGYAAGGMT